MELVYLLGAFLKYYRLLALEIKEDCLLCKAVQKETDEVKKFVKLLTKQNEPNTIDDQIDQFKTMELVKQKQMIEALERKPNNSDQSLMYRAS